MGSSINASIHAPARGATLAGPAPRARSALQSTLPHGERQNCPPSAFTRLTLQSTLPHGERLKNSLTAMTCGLLQSTLPHGERLLWLWRWRGRPHASIHAPARGATFAAQLEHGVGGASIHAPARGATRVKADAQLCDGLQSTLPHGERLACVFQTLTTQELQSTLPHGERRHDSGGIDTMTMLQSTLPHGERRCPPARTSRP